MTSRDHGDPGDAPSAPPPVTPAADDTRPCAAEEARHGRRVHQRRHLATLTADGDPWASLVTYGLLGGDSVLLLFALVVTPAATAIMLSIAGIGCAFLAKGFGGIDAE